MQPCDISWWQCVHAKIPLAQDMALADMLGFMPRMEDCAGYRMNLLAWLTMPIAYLRVSP